MCNHMDGTQIHYMEQKKSGMKSTSYVIPDIMSLNNKKHQLMMLEIRIEIVFGESGR